MRSEFLARRLAATAGAAALVAMGVVGTSAACGNSGANAPQQPPAATPSLTSIYSSITSWLTSLSTALSVPNRTTAVTSVRG